LLHQLDLSARHIARSPCLRGRNMGATSITRKAISVVIDFADEIRPPE